MSRSRLAGLLVFAAGLAIALFLQFTAGAYDGSWSGEVDEPSHFLDGLLVRDYLFSGFQKAPMPYAETYRWYYPKIALGHWPPLLSIVEAAWFFVVPVSY